MIDALGVTMKGPPLLLGLAIITLPTMGCESLGGGLDIVNETDQALYNVELIPRDGGRWRYSTNDCSDSDLTVTAEDGTVFAELTEEWCPGQTWTITGQGESILEDD